MASNRLQLILSNSCSAQQLHVPGSPKGTSKTAAKAPKQSSKVAPKLSPRALQRAISFVSFEDKTKESNNKTAATKQPKEKGKKMRQVEVIMEDQQLGEQKDAVLMAPMKRPKSGPAKKWTSAFRVVQSMTRFKNMPKRHHHPEGGSRGSSFSGSNESTPTRCTAQQEEEVIDPVYLALKQATAKYGSATGNGSGSRGGSRRGSQCALAQSHLFDSATPSPRNLSQTSLHDSGYSGGEIGSSRSRLVSGSTPHLHRIGVAPLAAIGGTAAGNGTAAPGATGAAPNGQPGAAGNGQPTGGQQSAQQPVQQGGRRPKLSEKMKSLSLDCAEMPPPVQPSFGRNQQYFKSKPIRSARGFAASGDSFEDAVERSMSPPATRAVLAAVQPRRLPPAPPQQVATAPAQPQSARQQNGTTAMPAVATAAVNAQIGTAAAATTVPSSATAKAIPIGTHIVIHEYIYGECNLYLGERLVVVDNGDPDWKHGFKVNDRLEQLYTFPSTCVAAFQPDEQPMRLIQNCNLVEQKLRLYRDQVVFVQPNSLRDDGRVLIRNEHDKFAYCPLQFLMLM